MDAITVVMLLYITSQASGSFALFQLTGRTGHRSTLRILGSSYLVIAASALLAVLGGPLVLPPGVWTIGSLVLGIAGYGLLLIGLRSLDFRRSRNPAIFLSGAILCILALGVLTPVWFNDSIRAMAFHFAVATLLGFSAWGIGARIRTECLAARKPKVIAGPSVAPAPG